MPKFFSRANYITAVIAGLFTAFSTKIFNSLILHFGIDNSPFSISFFCVGIISFVIPCILLIVGIDYIFFSIKKRVINFSIQSFIFPNNREDVKVLIRMLLWFVTASSAMMLWG
jgi:hypothetical protein